MKKFVDPRLFWGGIKNNTLILILYTGAAILTCIYSMLRYVYAQALTGAYFSFLTLSAALIFSIVFLIRQKQFLDLNEPGWSEEPDPGRRGKVFGALAASLLAQVFAPLLIGMAAADLTQGVLSKTAYQLRGTWGTFTAVGTKGNIYLLFIVLFIAAIEMLLWANFKSVARPVIFTALMPAMLIYLCVDLSFYLGRYIIGFRNPLYSTGSLINGVLTGQLINGQPLIIWLLLVLLAVAFALIFFGRRRYIKDSGKKPQRAVVYVALFLPCAILAFTGFFPADAFKTAANITEFVILAFITCIIIELLLFFSGFKFAAFIKRFAVLTVILSLMATGLRVDLPGFNRNPPAGSIKQAELQIYCFDAGTDSLQALYYSTLNKTFTLKSPGAVTAVAGIQKTLAGLEKAYVDSDTGTGGAEEEPNFVVDLTYGLKPIGSFDREYISTYDYGKISSLLRPLVETGEFKAQFYSALYTKCAEPLIFIGRLDDKDVQTGKSGIINKNADKAAALTQALKKDVQANSLAYLLDDRTKYQFSVEITVPETLKNYGHVISDVYYIPDSFKNTIAYIKGHEAELFTQGK